MAPKGTGKPRITLPGKPGRGTFIEFLGTYHVLMISKSGKQNLLEETIEHQSLRALPKSLITLIPGVRLIAERTYGPSSASKLLTDPPCGKPSDWELLWRNDASPSPVTKSVYLYQRIFLHASICAPSGRLTGFRSTSYTVSSAPSILRRPNFVIFGMLTPLASRQ